MDEFSFIKSVTPSTYYQSTLQKGIGDDAAVFQPNYESVVTSVDTMVEGVHFRLDTMEPYHIGYRALAANISDLAAMGSRPAYYLVSLVIPKTWTEEQLHDLYTGMNTLANRYHMDLIGGDTVSGEQLVISITVMGYVQNGKERYRHNAKAGDIIFVTGSLGDSAFGLHLLMHENRRDEYFINRHRLPTPRVEFSLKMLSINRLCLNDVSDGIANEANEIAEASNVDMHIDYNKLPITGDIKALPKNMQKRFVLSGGEDFELIGTVAQADWQDVLQAAKKANINVSKIGYVETRSKRDPVVYLYDADEQLQLQKTGYTHIKK
ncbi:thiamine-phosphate kinase [Salirhabdus salicampi]|uniref:thiamine-phosphate kinase n=1 Tax=Salirhabdus salicampi TaxID=476102 RepID=UPI0020C5AED6|nr:thiamine-phosphate kinase [Salirhabdus salicampi]MCP8617820.1 thiamine-phosphate kinase [Salirhabdus salicampi]